MAKIENKTREQVTALMAKFIKESFKAMTSNSKELNVELNNWCSGFGRNSKWSYTEIRFGGDSYIFKDKEIDDLSFVRMWEDAIAISKVRGKVTYDTYGDGYWTPKTYRFKRVEIFAKPCKEFISLVKLIEKYAKFSLSETDIFSVSVCGKRSSWNDSGRYYYLCYEPKKCQGIIDYIREQKSSRDTLSVSVEDYFSHGDNGDYKCAQYQESEWYGERGNKLVVKVTTPKGKAKAMNSWSMKFRSYID